MANYHNVQTDPGFSVPSSRELAWSQVSPTGTNYANSITFRHSANDTRQLVMRQSYFVISLTMTSAAAGAFQKAPDSSLLNEYVANRLFSRVSVSCSGRRISSSDSPSLMVPGWHEAMTRKSVNDTWGGALSKDGLVATTGDGTARTVFQVIYQPHMSIFNDWDHATPGGDWQFDFYPIANTSFGANAIFNRNDISANNATGINVAGATAVNVLCSITDMQMFVCSAVPQIPRAIPSLLSHVLSEAQVQQSSAVALNHNESFQVPPGTYHIQLYFQTTTTTFTEAAGASLPDVTSFSLTIAGQTLPQSPYSDLSGANGDLVKAYLDYVNARSRLNLEDDTPMTLAEFTAKPVFQYTLLREQGSSGDTALQLRVTRSGAGAACKAVLICWYDSLCALSFDKNELVDANVQNII